jgi:hypothetical protein
VLRDIGVRPSKGESLPLPATTPEDGYSRQAVMIANVLLEGRQHMGVDLPEAAEEALARDAQESKEAAKTPRTKLPRLSDFGGIGAEVQDGKPKELGITAESHRRAFTFPGT